MGSAGLNLIISVVLQYGQYVRPTANDKSAEELAVLAAAHKIRGPRHATVELHHFLRHVKVKPVMPAIAWQHYIRHPSNTNIVLHRDQPPKCTLYRYCDACLLKNKTKQAASIFDRTWRPRNTPQHIKMTRKKNSKNMSSGRRVF